MNNKLLSASAVAVMLTATTALTAQAAPAPGGAAHVQAGIVHSVHWDGGRRWDDDRPWWRRHRYRGDWGPWYRRSWHHHRGDWDRHGDHHHHGDHGHHREHRRGEWR